MDKKVLIDYIRESLEVKKTEQVEKIENALWTTKMVNDFPDSSFAVVEKGGKKDAEGKTTPRGYRHLPYKNASGEVDLPHLRNALARMNQIQAASPKDSTERIRAVARRVLIAAAKKHLPNSQFAKGELLGAKASIANVDQVGECKYVDVTFNVDMVGPDNKPYTMPVTMPFDLMYNGDGQLTNVKFYWQQMPAEMLGDFSDFLKTLENQAAPADTMMEEPMDNKDMPNGPGY